MILHKTSPWKIGLAQAAIVLSYILLFALGIQMTGNLSDDAIQPDPIVGIAFFLTTFVFSALFCSTAMLGYSILLCFEKNYRRATHVVLWSIGWLATFLVVGGAIVLSISL